MSSDRPGVDNSADVSSGVFLADEIEPERRTYLQQVVHDTLTPLTSRAGLVWIAVLALLAAFGPFIANSDPILLKSAGHWSSPMLQGLSPVDIALVATALAAMVALFTHRLTLPQGLALAIWMGAMAYAAAAWPSARDYWLQLRQWFSVPLAAFVAAAGIATSLAMIVLIPLFALSRRAIVAGGIVAVVLAAVLAIYPVRPPLNIVYERYRQLDLAGKADTVVGTLIPYSANDRLRDQPGQRLSPPGTGHWLGTDTNGADVLSRMIHASRIALSIGFIATGIAVVIGVFIGGLMGYFSGTVDLIGMRLIEMFEAIPRLVLLVAVTASFGRNLYLMMAVIGLLSWTGDARFIRAEFLKLRQQDFVQAAIACGLPLRSILFRHMLPNGIAPVLVSASFGVASAILLESTLSFLGLGLVDEPSWGQMLNQAREGGTGFNWWIAVFPGLAIFLTVFAYNLVGEAIRDALDPKLLKRE